MRNSAIHKTGLGRRPLLTFQAKSTLSSNLIATEHLESGYRCLIYNGNSHEVHLLAEENKPYVTRDRLTKKLHQTSDYHESGHLDDEIDYQTSDYHESGHLDDESD